MFFAKDKFLSGLRVVLALDPSRVALGEVVIDAINNEYIPELTTMYNKETDERKKEDIAEMIEVWEDYGDRTSSNGRKWNKVGIIQVNRVGNAWHLGESAKEDLAQDLAGRFFGADPSRKKLRNFIIEYDPMKGPNHLLGKFSKAIYQEGIHMMRLALPKQMKNVSLDVPEGVGETLKEIKETDLDRYEINEFKKEMAKWVRRKLQKKEQKMLFDMWLGLAEDKGAANVNFSRDIYPEWGEATGKSSSSMDGYWKLIKQTIVDFLREEGMRPSKKLLKNLKVSHAVARSFIRRRISEWLLELAKQRGGV
jgi:hypothetical protein